VLRQRIQLEGERARVGGVDQEQVEHQQQLRLREVAAPVDRPDPRRLEHPGKRPLHDDAVFEDVRNARRTPQVVFEHVDLTVAVPHQIRPGDVAPAALGRVQPDALGPEAGGRRDDLSGDDAVLDDLLFVVDVIDKEVERGDPLAQPALDDLPLRSGHDARQQIEREDALGAGAVAVDVEGDAHVEQCALGRTLALQELALGQAVDELDERLGLGPRTGRAREHLVVVLAGGVVGEPHRQKGNLNFCTFEAWMSPVLFLSTDLSENGERQRFCGAAL
jgi:hypothetical protein